MNFEQSPSLKDFKHGLQEDQPPKKRLSLPQLVILVLLVSVIGLSVVVFIRSDNQQLVRGVGSIRGSVVNEQGQPFQAEIYILGSEILSKADSNGYFEISGVPAGKQYLIVADEYVGHEFQIAVLPGEMLDVGVLRFISTATP